MFKRLKEWWDFWLDLRAFMKEMQEAKNETTSK